MPRQIPTTTKSKGFEFSNGDHGTRFEIIGDSGLDEDTGTVFSWNPTGIEPYHQVELRFLLHNEGGSNMNVNLQVNGITSTDYRYTVLDGDAFSVLGSQSSWLLAKAPTGWPVSGSLTITAGMLSTGNVQPSIDGDVATFHHEDRLAGGDLNSEVSHIDALNLTTSLAATGKAVAIGWKL